MRQWERDRSCFDHLSPCMSQFYCWLPRRIRQQRRGYASGGIFTMAEADFTTTESTRKQVPCGPGERSRQSHMGQGLPPICIRPAIRFIAISMTRRTLVPWPCTAPMTGSQPKGLPHDALETRSVVGRPHLARSGGGLAGGTGARAIQYSGEQRVREAIQEALKSRQRDGAAGLPSTADIFEACCHGR
jgi:hypothetical protein